MKLINFGLTHKYFDLLIFFKIINNFFFYKMSEIYEILNNLEEPILKTLKSENQQIDEIISILTRSVKITTERIRRQFKSYILESRKQEIYKILTPIHKDLLKSDFLIKKINFLLEKYNEVKPGLDMILPSFSFNQININKSEIVKKFEEYLSKFSFENFSNSFEIIQNTVKVNVRLNLFDIEKYRETTVNKAHNTWLKSIAFLPYKLDNDNIFQENESRFLKILVSSDTNATLKFRNWVSGNCYEEISNSHESPLNIIKIIKDKTIDKKYYLISGGDDGLIKFWDVSSNQYKSIFSFRNNDDVNHLEIIPNIKHPDGQDLLVTVGNKNQIKIWNWSIKKQKTEILRRIQIKDLSFVSCLKSLTFESYIFNNYKKHNYLLTGFENGKVCVWDPEKANPLVLCILDEDFGAVRSLLCIKQYYKSYQSLIKTHNFYFLYVIGNSMGTIKFYDRKGKLIKVIRGAHEGETSALETLPISEQTFFNGYSEILISGGTDRFIKFWKWRSGEILKILSCDHKIIGYNCLKVENVYDMTENKEKYIIISGGKRPNDICQISIWKY